MAVARDLLEQARAVEAERARVAAEEAAAVEAAEWLRSEQDLAALTEGAADANSAGKQRRASSRGGRRGDTVRGVHGRAQEPRGAAVHAHVRV